MSYLKHGWASGGAGYVISKPAVVKIVNDGYKFPKQCPQDGIYEDLDIAR